MYRNRNLNASRRYFQLFPSDDELGGAVIMAEKLFSGSGAAPASYPYLAHINDAFTSVRTDLVHPVYFAIPIFAFLHALRCVCYVVLFHSIILWVFISAIIRVAYAVSRVQRALEGPGRKLSVGQSIAVPILLVFSGGTVSCAYSCLS
jgi:hypothetical protein